jgi:hypothetical protein
MTSYFRGVRSSLSRLVLAGLAGGIAEVLWVGAYCALTPLSASEGLRQISASVVPTAAHSAGAPALGMVIHLSLSVALAMAYGLTMGIAPVRRPSQAGVIARAVAALTAVWLFNFFVLLPQLNPAFVDLLPYPVTLLSKLLFGVAMGYALHLGYVMRTAGLAPRVVAPMQGCVDRFKPGLL